MLVFSFSCFTSGNVSAITCLHSLGALADVKNTPGSTPLHFAVVNERLDAARALIGLNVDVNAKVTYFLMLGLMLPHC